MLPQTTSNPEYPSSEEVEAWYKEYMQSEDENIYNMTALEFVSRKAVAWARKPKSVRFDAASSLGEAIAKAAPSLTPTQAFDAATAILKESSHRWKLESSISSIA